MEQSPHAHALRKAEEFFDRSTRPLEEADSAFAPLPGMYTVAQQVAHVAQSVEWFMEGGFGLGFDLDFARAEAEIRASASLDQARGRLARAFAAARSTVAGKSEEQMRERLPHGLILPGEPLAAVIAALCEHTAHHRGALTVYCRLLGRIPPMPYGEFDPIA